MATSSGESGGDLGEERGLGAAPGGVSDEPSSSRDEGAAAQPAGSRASVLWASVVVALVVLLALAVFILENGQHVKVSYFGAHGSLPLGVALLLAAVFGGLVVVLAGTVRILQLRRHARRERRSHRRRAGRTDAA